MLCWSALMFYQSGWLGRLQTKFTASQQSRLRFPQFENGLSFFPIRQKLPPA
jgi:hypothetical protein